jgi:hypothetical protein
MHNEMVASKLNYVSDLHKLFHHYYQLVCSFLGMSPRQKDGDSSEAGPSQFTGEYISLRNSSENHHFHLEWCSSYMSVSWGEPGYLAKHIR